VTLPPPTLAHDYLLVLRGAERTFAAMADLWPQAPVHTLLYDGSGGVGARFAGHEIHTSYLQRLRVGQRHFRNLLPLFPHAVGHLQTKDAPLIVSSSSAFAHGVPAGPAATHVCYCHSPFRYAWHERERGMGEVPRALAPALGVTLARIRAWDRLAAGRVTRLVANSAITQARIADFWGRDSSVVHPPVEVDRFRVGTAEGYGLIVGELVQHKRVEFALEAARRAGRTVKVVGQGPERERLEQLYGDRAHFVGRAGDAELVDLYAGASVFLMANVEEFGIAAVEAQAAGVPVLGVAAGGAQETVIDGETGVLVPVGDETAFAEALRHVDFDRFDRRAIARHARRFSPQAFQRGLLREVEEAVAAPG
jgi:glycosyltransferase involved in cell wall biosynthesis